MMTRVGDIRRALAGIPDDDLVLFQVAAEDGKAWLLGGDIAPLGQGRVVVTLSHPLLKTLPSV